MLHGIFMCSQFYTHSPCFYSHRNISYEIEGESEIESERVHVVDLLRKLISWYDIDSKWETASKAEKNRINFPPHFQWVLQFQFTYHIDISVSSSSSSPQRKTQLHPCPKKIVINIFFTRILQFTWWLLWVKVYLISSHNFFPSPARQRRRS